MPINIYRKFTRIPIFGSYLKIANAYAYKGNSAYIRQLAPFNNWYIRVLPAWFYSIVFSIIVTTYVKINSVADFDAGAYIIGAIPDLVGFGIGVFALIFVLPNNLITFINKNGGKSFPVEEIPADFAYPLMGLVFSLVVSFLLELIPDESTIGIFAEVTIFFYSFIMITEMIMFIYTLTRASQSNRLTKKERFCHRVKKIK
tara:strand:+ start:5944 stop:6546 length:603 start_codon:yes stop_codon:yes gene_type:complete